MKLDLPIESKGYLLITDEKRIAFEGNSCYEENIFNVNC